jgi:hypothetical protein
VARVRARTAVQQASSRPRRLTPSSTALLRRFGLRNVRYAPFWFMQGCENRMVMRFMRVGNALRVRGAAAGCSDAARPGCSGRASHLRPKASRRGARSQPRHDRPPSRTEHRHRKDALGPAPDSRRRARAVHESTSSSARGTLLLVRPDVRRPFASRSSTASGSPTRAGCLSARSRAP